MEKVLRGFGGVKGRLKVVKSRGIVRINKKGEMGFFYVSSLWRWMRKG